MDPLLYNLLEPIVILSFLSLLTYGAKTMIWGKGPIRKLKKSKDTDELEQRIADLEDILEQHHLETLERQTDLEERLDFAERIIAQQQAKQLNVPVDERVATPV